MICTTGDHQGNIQIELTMGPLSDEQTGEDADNSRQTRGIFPL
jgi:hypothetical protein